MKILYLVRHAKSSWEDQSLSDFQRPLNPRGERDAPDMGHRLMKMGIMPDLMLSSPAVRAITTCETIADQLGYAKDQIEKDKAIYHAGEFKLLEVVHEINDHVKSLMLFGHNPGITEFANALTNSSIDNIPTCGVFACSFDIIHWSDVQLGNGKLLFYDYPKNQ
ncbi:MAG TPA: histidine phosphatase family protein [Fulvivirga sp.]|nr:histidine phosphatase family protein [Fulvivirga sp.]